MKNHLKTTKVLYAALYSGLLAITIGGILWASYGRLWQDPSAVAAQNATNKLYDAVAYEASSLHGSIADKNTAGELASIAYSSENHIELQQSIVQSSDIAYWDARAQAQGDTTVAFSHEVQTVYACIRYTANVKTKQVTVTANTCNPKQDFKEVTVDISKVTAIRGAHKDLFYCYENYTPETSGRNAQDYTCR